jgi:Fe-S-cluster-containing dehydrogenase component
MPVQCQQCKNPPCVKVCPGHATWQEKDGITVIDYDWCIGCRYCEAACPYWARRFNFTKPSIPEGAAQPRHVLPRQPPRRQGVMEKCHFCIQRTRAGPLSGLPRGLPRRRAQVRQHPRSNSEVSYILRTKRVFIQLKGGNGHLAAVLLLLRRMINRRPQLSRVSPALRRIAFVGDWRYYTWMGLLTVLCLLGLNAYASSSRTA